MRLAGTLMVLIATLSAPGVAVGQDLRPTDPPSGAPVPIGPPEQTAPDGGDPVGSEADPKPGEPVGNSNDARGTSEETAPRSSAGDDSENVPAADTSQTSGTNCHPSYSPQCLDPNAEDYDCKGGGGDGPKFVEGPVQVDGPDEYELDRDGNGTGCEEGESGSTSTGTVPRGGVATGFGGASTESPHDDEADGRFVLGVAGLSLLLVGLAVGGRALARNP